MENKFYTDKGIVEYTDTVALKAAMGAWNNGVEIFTYKEKPISEEVALERAVLGIERKLDYTSSYQAFKQAVANGLKPASFKLIYSPVVYYECETDKADIRYEYSDEDDDYSGSVTSTHHYCKKLSCKLYIHYGSVSADEDPIVANIETAVDKSLAVGKTYWFDAESAEQAVREIKHRAKIRIDKNIGDDTRKWILQKNRTGDSIVTNHSFDVKYYGPTVFFMPVYELTYIFNGKPITVLVNGFAKDLVYIYSEDTSQNTQKDDAKSLQPYTQSAKHKSDGKKKKKGCYIATAVYRSYDCPEVWTLRRYRDFELSRTRRGRLFVKIYYALSPAAVRLFGKTKWFNAFWRKRLDRKVQKLKNKGIQDSPYTD